ncbi:MAG: NADPH-dependent 7-cyano-7-deazaguanine reductase QueF [Chloroflexi bacterium]|nr:NADPH-dependent 7-cyano-7-deazaguanine reductase QueF [Chloroflexota bacterium]
MRQPLGSQGRRAEVWTLSAPQRIALPCQAAYNRPSSGREGVDRIEDLKRRYEGLEWKGSVLGEEAIDSGCLLAFEYEYPASDAEVSIDTDEFTAVCPWTGLPDFGALHIRYVPYRLCIELKSLKYYLLSYRSVGTVQEHAANRILKDLIAACRPKRMSVTLDYLVRGGIHTAVTVSYQAPEV